METVFGVEYSKPEVILMQDTGIGVAEAAARTCYDSFENSENEAIRSIEYAMPDGDTCGKINTIEESNLLNDLAWTHFHHSILEHARHRIQAISVRSTRYTMSSVINAFVASQATNDKNFFIDKVLGFEMLVTCDEAYNRIEIGAIYDKLKYQASTVENFNDIAVAKSSLPLLEEFDGNSEMLFNALEEGEKKRNVGDAFKHVVTDNFKVDMVVTFNLRSLKNYFTLRDSGAAYFQIRWLAQEMMRKTPSKYLDLIIKKG